MDQMKIHWCNKQPSMGEKIKLLWKFTIAMKIYEFDEVNYDISSMDWNSLLHYCNDSWR